MLLHEDDAKTVELYVVDGTEPYPQPYNDTVSSPSPWQRGDSSQSVKGIGSPYT